MSIWCIQQWGNNSRSSSMYCKPLSAGASSSGHAPMPAGSATSVSHGAVPPELLSPSSPNLLESAGDPPADTSSGVVATGIDAEKLPASVSKKPLIRRVAKSALTKPEIRKPCFLGTKDNTAQVGDVQDLSVEEETSGIWCWELMLFRLCYRRRCEAWFFLKDLILC